MPETEKPPFTLTADLDQPEASRGSAVPLTITATRSAGFTEEIALSPINLPANVTAALKNIPKGEHEIKGQLTPAANAPLGQFTISVTGKVKFQNRDYAVTARPFSLALAPPFELQIEPAMLPLPPGGKVKASAVVEAALTRIDVTEPTVNAFTDIVAERARKRAAEIDAGRHRGSLMGVPFAVKNLFDIEGLPYEEIASIVGVPLGTVKSRLFNARAALREKLAGNA